MMFTSVDFESHTISLSKEGTSEKKKGMDYNTKYKTDIHESILI